jgi:hypothetical protein
VADQGGIGRHCGSVGSSPRGDDGLSESNHDANSNYFRQALAIAAQKT